MEEVNEMDGDSDLREIVGKEVVRWRRLMRWMGHSDLKRDSWKRRL